MITGTFFLHKAGRRKNKSVLHLKAHHYIPPALENNTKRERQRKAIFNIAPRSFLKCASFNNIQFSQ